MTIDSTSSSTNSTEGCTPPETPQKFVGGSRKTKTHPGGSASLIPVRAATADGGFPHSIPFLTSVSHKPNKTNYRFIVIHLSLTHFTIFLQNNSMGLSKKRSIVDSPVSLIVAKRKRSKSIDGRLSPHELRLPIKKNVTFASNNDGSLKTTERYLDLFRSDLDKPNMWYSKDEREKMLEECQEAIDDFRLANLEQTSNYQHVLDQCNQMPSQESSDYLETAQLDIPATARGMEWGWTESYKRNHVRDLLGAQNQLQGLHPAMRDRVLASRSLKTSRPGRVLARLLGECDARNARSD